MPTSLLRSYLENQRFWSKVDFQGPVMPGMTTRCWVWTRCIGKRGGYGLYLLNRKVVVAHRVSYELMVGLLPPSSDRTRTLDHLCVNPACVRPDHLELVEHRVNVLRGNGLSAANAAKTHCKNGHEFTPENTYLRRTKGRPQRQCRACRCSRQKAYVKRAKQ